MFHIPYWPTDEDHTYVDFIRDGMCGNSEACSGNTRWRRITEERAKGKSVVHFDVPGSVAKSTHAGRSAVLEVYPSLWSKRLPREGRTLDQHDAYVAAS